ncbi:host attachment protein [Variovorax ginsengisoli]|uniref:Host attachment protein n=1 Tax=Variovorax ginsengisoli TaxID=363844 RepID=A0ABT8SFZ1_9BURK|nr:host attachment protein [Variovorax ginsengisoli]MDN8618089.1 host attachment protein [Variovorax ginsengisoli]MDO1537259.1 host attachment protein [Variovorax ginsengisoli]
MERIWFVVADQGRARVLERAKPRAPLQELQDLRDELALLPGAELRRDAKGRLYGRGERFMGHTTEPKTEPHRKEAQRFARQIAHLLEQACNERRYDRLLIAAAPAFLGVLRQELPERVRKVLAGELDQDLVNLDVHQLEQRLHALPAHA